MNKIAVFGLLFSSIQTFAYNYSGRLTVGTYAGRETLAEASGGDYSNNAATASGRFFLRFTEISDAKLEVVSDVRDKNDFFGLVDKERLQLKGKNTLQLRQLSVKYPGTGFFSELGRFAIPEAGAVYTDGGLAGYKLSRDFRLALFGGLNPKRPEQTYLQFNSDSQVIGSYLTFTPPFNVSGYSISLDTAVATNRVKGLTDRTYFYTNTAYQWGVKNRARLLTYLDFVPNTYLQNATLNVQQDFGFGWLGMLNLLSIDVLEYQRLQSVRTTLPSSPYREAGIKLRLAASEGVNLEASILSGNRAADGLSRKAFQFTTDFSRLFGKRWAWALIAGYRDNFTSNDLLAETRLTYDSNLWQADLDVQFLNEQQKTGGLTYHPFTTELSVSRIFDNAVYGTLSLQDVRDERVQITSIFLKLSYRFGSKEIPPVRDGAPPMGRL